MEIIVPKGKQIRSVDDAKQQAPPTLSIRWKEGRSATESARAWGAGKDSPLVPAELTELLEYHADTRGMKIESVWPERQERFDHIEGEPRNSDVAAVGRNGRGEWAISIEARPAEPFDYLMSEVLVRGAKLVADNKTTGSIERVAGLLATLFNAKPDDASVLALRYQLLTGVAGAIAFARERGIPRAVFIVHELASGEPATVVRNTQDLDAFAKRLSNGAVPSLTHGRLRGPILVADMQFYIGKMHRRLEA